MNLKLKSPLSTAIAIGIGIIILLGYFFGAKASGEPTTLGILQDYLLHGAIVWAAVALLVGVANLASVHIYKVKQGQKAGYSFVLLLSFIITVGVGLYDISNAYLKKELNFQRTQWLFNNVQLPIEMSLMAVLAISLTYAVARLLYRRLNFLSIVFVVVVIFLLIGAAPQIGAIAPFLIDTRNWIMRVPTTGGARGILLGMALGTIATGIRVLTGSDRPYGG